MSNAQNKLAELRAKLLKEAERKGGGDNNNKSGSFDTRYYPFFLIDVDESCTLRFVEDADEDNPWFFKEKQMYDWTFADPDNPGETVRIKIPCRNMYREKSDPVLKLISEMFDAGGETKEKARKVWVKKTYLYQGFVRKSSYEEENVPENPIRVFDISKSLHGGIYKSLIETDEELALPGVPTDDDEGLNFTIKKFKNGDFNNYSGSFSMKQTSLTDDERAALEQHGAYNLSELLPKEPSEEAYALLPEMLEAALEGDAWNPAWEEHWKPFGRKGSGSSEAAAPAARKKQAPMVEELEEEAEAPAAKEDAPMKAKSTSDVLAKLKAKKAAQG